jgi:hypothetical protein
MNQITTSSTRDMSQVRASHLLVKHQGSRRPASWKDESGAVITKRTKEQVRVRAPLTVLHSKRT